MDSDHPFSGCPNARQIPFKRCISAAQAFGIQRTHAPLQIPIHLPSPEKFQRKSNAQPMR
eukprot:11217711-Lingulodinium_polyedra.AAC.1